MDVKIYFHDKNLVGSELVGILKEEIYDEIYEILEKIAESKNMIVSEIVEEDVIENSGID